MDENIEMLKEHKNDENNRNKSTEKILRFASDEEINRALKDVYKECASVLEYLKDK